MKIAYYTTVVCVLLLLLFGSYLPDDVSCALYTASANIQAVLMFVIPILVFAYVSHSLLELGTDSFKLVLFIVIAVGISNFTAIWIAYFISTNLSLSFGDNDTSNVMNMMNRMSEMKILKPFFIVNLPSIFNTGEALLLAIFGSIFISFLHQDNIFAYSFRTVSNKLYYIVENYFLKIFTLVLPLFVMGFIAKIQNEGNIYILKDVIAITLLVICITCFYSMLLYLIIHAFNLCKTINCVRNVFLPVCTAFATLSSIIVIPMTIAAVEDYVENKKGLRFIIPFISNVHVIGGCIFFTTMTVAIIQSFGHIVPSYSEFLSFSLIYTVSLFSVVGIPGGSLFVLLPLVAQHLHFNSEMLAILGAVYILFDSFIAAMNVFSNAAFSIIVSKLGTHYRVF